MLNNKTIICGVIGHPVSHSLSPTIHNAAFRHCGLNYAYYAFDVPKESLGDAIMGAKALSFAGLSVTIPHKVAVLPLLDKLDPLAKEIGAVNTVVNDNGFLKGYNTDVSGFLDSIHASGIILRNKRVLLLGAGGVARAIAFALSLNGAQTHIASRLNSYKKAVEIASNLSSIHQDSASALVLNDENLQSEVKQADVIVNATSIGMEPESLMTPIPARLLRPGLVVFDAVYSHGCTRLISEAKEKGCVTISGQEMLIRQGAAAFKLWTKKDAPTDIMFQSIQAPQLVGDISLNKNIIFKTSLTLIGFMGAGKTTVGKALAEKTLMEFVDTDQLIEKESGKTISGIFSTTGESSFRHLEKTALHEALKQGKRIIACGGGIVLDKANIVLMKKHSIVIYLKCSANILKTRLSLNKNARPLLQGEKWQETIDCLLKERTPLYEEAADITINCDELDTTATVNSIIKKVEENDCINL